jgi:predicted TIM-barrel fold metal-dependent hydrolase
VADLVERQPRFIGFASVDPSLPKAPDQLRQAVRELGLRGLNLDPAFQRFELCDQDKLFPVLQVCSELNVPVLIHTGMSWTPTGLARLARPFLLEDAVQAFSGLNFILGHFGWPWLDEAVMLAVKYPNVYADTAILYSGTPRDTMKRCLSDHIGLDTIERSLATKIVFGTDYPRIDMRRCVRGMRALDLSASTQENIFHANALRLLGMERRP